MSTITEFIEKRDQEIRINLNDITFHLQESSSDQSRKDILTTDWKCKKFDISYDGIVKAFNKFKKNTQIPDAMSCVAGIPKQIGAALFYHDDTLQRHERCCLHKMIMLNHSEFTFFEILMKGRTY